MYLHGVFTFLRAWGRCLYLRLCCDGLVDCVASTGLVYELCFV